VTGWRLSLAVRAAEWLIRLLWATVRVRVVHGERYTGARAGGGHVTVFWHGEILGYMVHHGPDAPHALVSQSKDGEAIAQLGARFGAKTIRGSSSRGGAEALVQAIHTAQRGVHVAITPDGPRGPRHSVAPGAVKIAQRAGVPLVPVRIGYSRAWRLSSWDRFEIPKPFARATVAYGTPLRVSADARGDALAAARDALARAMAETGADAGCPP
jgi:lysophospholipid acyltransferase (LPLAT)-like uncharacterized protein